MPLFPRGFFGSKVVTYRTYSLPAKARFLKSMPLTSEKTVAFAPMPRASAITATAVNPGAFASVRNAKRRSCHIDDRYTHEGGSRFRLFTTELHRGNRRARVAVRCQTAN